MREHVRTGTEVLDGLRGAAILLVLAYHTWLFSWYTPAAALFGAAIPLDVPVRAGYLGVDVFFVISGFVLYFPYAIAATTGAGRTHGLAAFARRRVAKIVPSYLVALAVTALSARALHIDFSPVRTFLAHVLFYNSFTNDELGQANSVFWSLSIEVQFYVVFPLLAWCFRRVPYATFAGTLLVAIAYRYAVAPCCLLWEPTFRALPAFLDLFGSGMFAAYVLVRIRTREQNGRAVEFAALAAALASLAAFWILLEGANAVAYATGGAQRFDVGARTLIALAVAAFAVASCLAPRAWRAVVANPVLRFLSLISYNLYLWHTLVMIWFWHGNVLPHAHADPHADDRWKALFIGITWPLAIGISTALTYFLERPILATIAPHDFAFDWKRATRAFRSRRATSS